MWSFCWMNSSFVNIECESLNFSHPSSSSASSSPNTSVEYVFMPGAPGIPWSKGKQIIEPNQHIITCMQGFKQVVDLKIFCISASLDGLAPSGSSGILFWNRREESLTRIKLEPSVLKWIVQNKVRHKHDGIKRSKKKQPEEMLWCEALWGFGREILFVLPFIPENTSKYKITGSGTSEFQIRLCFTGFKI